MTDDAFADVLEDASEVYDKDLEPVCGLDFETSAFYFKDGNDENGKVHIDDIASGRVWLFASGDTDRISWSADMGLTPSQCRLLAQMLLRAAEYADRTDGAEYGKQADSVEVTDGG